MRWRSLVLLALLAAAAPAGAIVIDCPDGRICAVDDPAKCACVQMCGAKAWVFKGEPCPTTVDPYQWKPGAEARPSSAPSPDTARDSEPKARGSALSLIIGLVVLTLFGAGAILLYVLPGVIAVRRRHPNATAIVALNLLLGWTFLGWVAALVWALTAVEKESVES